MPNIPAELEKYRVQAAPSAIYYVEDFITEEEEQILLDEVYSCPKPKWEVLSNRRLQTFGGVVVKNVLLPKEDYTPNLRTLMKKIDALGVLEKPTNHVLVNEYESGQGIMPHTDGPAYYPVVSTVSLGSHTLLDLYDNSTEREGRSLDDRYNGSMFLARRSLVLIADHVYSNMMHGIKEVTEDVLTDRVWNVPKEVHGTKLERGTRVSLTIRNVPKISKLNLNSLIMKK